MAKDLSGDRGILRVDGEEGLSDGGGEDAL